MESCLVKPDSPGHFGQVLICPKCRDQKMRSILSQPSGYVAEDKYLCPVHGVLSGLELMQARNG
jgi:hypothetical protein